MILKKNCSRATLMPRGDIEAITRYDTFVEALRFGILLMIEVFSDDDSE